MRNCPVILNAGTGSWAFEELANELSDVLWVDVSPKPGTLNYVLSTEEKSLADSISSFIPQEARQIAADKRLTASRFLDNGVPTPKTFLVRSRQEVSQVLRQHPNESWCLKWPTGCGAVGHRILNSATEIPENWPRPFVLQAFVRMPVPEVYRAYCAAGQVFGWTVRRYPESSAQSPWVAHARGAQYEDAGKAPAEAICVANHAFTAVGLLNSFGCVDLLPSITGWLALEVGTDGIFNYVDRSVGNATLKSDLDRRLAMAFWRDIGPQPWGCEPWHRRGQPETPIGIAPGH